MPTSCVSHAEVQRVLKIFSVEQCVCCNNYAQCILPENSAKCFVKKKK
jgi:hypothetical protein